MTTREALAELAKVGIHLTVWRVRSLFDRGLEKPRLNSSLSWDWTPDDIERVRTAVLRREAAGASSQLR